MIGAKYSKAERTFLEEGLPPGCYLDFDFSSGIYDIKHRVEGSTHGKTVAKVSRRTIQQYYRPKRTLNYVTRRAMKERGLPIEMKLNKKEDVES